MPGFYASAALGVTLTLIFTWCPDGVFAAGVGPSAAVEQTAPQGSDPPGPDNGKPVPPLVEDNGVILPPPTADEGIHTEAPNPTLPGTPGGRLKCRAALKAEPPFQARLFHAQGDGRLVAEGLNRPPGRDADYSLLSGKWIPAGGRLAIAALPPNGVVVRLR